MKRERQFTGMGSLYRSNSGVSLVELVIGMAILTLIGFAIASLMRSGTMSYASTSKEVNLQYDAQLVTNQINDLLTEADGDVSFYVDGITGPVVSEGGSPAVADKHLYIVTSNRTIEDDGSGGKETKVAYKGYDIMWDADAQELWLIKGSVVEYDATKKMYKITSSGGSDHELLAEKVSMMTADIGETENDIVKMIINFSDGMKDFESTTNISLRNAPTRNASSIDWKDAGLGGEGGEGGGGIPTPNGVKSVKVTPSTISLKPGDEYVFKAKVEVTGSTNKGVLWSVVNNSSSGTTIDGAGKLSIGSDESSEKIYVKAAAQADETKMDSATVIVQVFQSADITWLSGSRLPGETFTLKSTVTGVNVDPNSQADQQVKWNIVGNARYVSQIGANNFRISAGAPVGAKLSFTVTSLRDTRVVSPVYVVVVDDPGGTSPEEEEKANVKTDDEGWKNILRRGESGTLTVTTTNAKNRTMKFVVDVREGTENGWGIGTEIKSGYTFSSSGSACTVSVLKSFAYDKEAKIRVRGYLLAPGESVNDADCIVEKVAVVQKVEMRVTTRKDMSGLAKKIGDRTGEELLIMYRKGPEKVYYELTGIVDADITWKVDKKELLNVNKDDDHFNFSSPSIEAGAAETDSNEADEEKIKATAYAYIGSYDLGCSVKVKVKPGNVLVQTNIRDYTSNTAVTNKVWIYLPLPDDEDINQDNYFNTTKGLCKEQYNGFQLVNAPDKSYFKLDNTSNMYCYYWYRPIVNYNYPYEPTRPEEYRCVFRENILGTFNGSLYNVQYDTGWAAVKYLEGMGYIDDTSVMILSYKPGIDTFWVKGKQGE